MASKKFKNQSLEQVLAHLKSSMQEDLSFNLEVDTIANIARIEVSRFGKRGSKKKEHVKKSAETLRPRKRKLASAAKRREKPKLKHVRNGRTVTLTGYSPKTNY
jgi:hypothetical protein